MHKPNRTPLEHWGKSTNSHKMCMLHTNPPRRAYTSIKAILCTLHTLNYIFLWTGENANIGLSSVESTESEVNGPSISIWSAIERFLMWIGWGPLWFKPILWLFSCEYSCGTLWCCRIWVNCSSLCLSHPSCRCHGDILENWHDRIRGGQTRNNVIIIDNRY